MNDIQRVIENMSIYVRWGVPSIKKADAKTCYFRLYSRTPEAN